jgi:hypothetical protein
MASQPAQARSLDQEPASGSAVIPKALPTAAKKLQVKQVEVNIEHSKDGKAVGPASIVLEHQQTSRDVCCA